MHKQMAPAYGLKSKTKPWLGGLGVVLVHVFLLGVLQSGLGQSLLKKAPVVVVAELITAPEAPAPQPVPPSPPVQPQQTPPPALTRAAPALVAPPVQQVLPDALVQAAPMPQPTPAQPPVASSEAPAITTPVAPVALSTPVRVPATLQASGKCAKPEYPALSRRKEEEGSVQLKFYIGVQGQVLDSQIEKSSGYARLDEAARTALAQCQFKPGAIDGKPEPSWASLKYTWRLD